MQLDDKFQVNNNVSAQIRYEISWLGGAVGHSDIKKELNFCCCPFYAMEATFLVAPTYDATRSITVRPYEFSESPARSNTHN